MTTHIIYHNFQATSEAQAGILNTSSLRKARRLRRLVNRFNHFMSSLCVFLCGACTVLCLFILLSLILQK